MSNQFKTPLFSALKDYRDKKVTPFDVPGHKRGVGSRELKEFFGPITLETDVNSMKPLDNASNPIGVIKEAETLMAEAFGADYAFFLVNGTTHGVQAMIMSVCKPGEKIIMPRNVHKSAIKALILSGAIPVYIQPEIDPELGIANGITVENVKKAIEEHSDAKAVFIINPTYYGVVSDLEKIIELAHSNNMMAIVDEAHGAHFKFNSELPKSAMLLGADMSSASLHKTGGSLTQSSVLLINERSLTRDKVKTILNLTQTTSASYILMSSLDVARKQLATEGKEILQKVLELTRYAREEINRIDGLYAFGKELIDNKGVYDFDETKLGVKVSDLGLTGFQVYDLLRDKYNIQVEFGDNHNILAIVSLGDTKESLNTLINALKDISINYKTDEKIVTKLNLSNPAILLSPRDAFYSERETVALEDAAGRICGEHIMAYPPGIPVVSPGEVINLQMVEHIKFLKSEHSMLTGTEDPDINYIKVIKEEGE